jgi:hypothetical protein
MINPTKASYSMAPTMRVCAAAGYLTAKLFSSGARRERLVLTASIGLLIGLSVSFRLPNLFLSAGYFIFFLGSFLMVRSKEGFSEGLAFAIAFLVGLAPTLAANAINAGSPFATTYGGVDAVPPELNATVLWSYLADVQFILLAIAAAWTALIWRFNDRQSARHAALIVAGPVRSRLKPRRYRSAATVLVLPRSGAPINVGSIMRTVPDQLSSDAFRQTSVKSLSPHQQAKQIINEQGYRSFRES